MKSFDYYQKCMEKTDLSENSISTYMRNLRKIFKEHFACETPNPLFFKDHKSTIEYIDSLPTNASRKTMCTSIIVMLKHHSVFPKKNQGNLFKKTNINSLCTKPGLYRKPAFRERKFKLGYKGRDRRKNLFFRKRNE